MVDVDVIRTLYRYHYQRFREIWDSMMTLSEEQFVQPVPYSTGSLRNHVVHVVDDDASWFALLAQNERPLPLLPEDFNSRTEVRARYDEAEASILDYVLNLDETIFQKEFVWHPASTASPQFVTASQVLLHVVNHGTDHRAQILRILHDFGAPSFDQDLMGHLVQTGQTAARR